MFAGANIKCLPYAAFFGYFLGGARKYRSRQGIHKFVSYIIYYFSQKEKQVTKNLHLGLLFGNFYDNI